MFSTTGVSIVIAALIIFAIGALTSALLSLNKANKSNDEIDAAKVIMKQSRTTLYSLLIIAVAILAGGQILGSGMEAHVMDWLNLLVRWTHVVFGIAWIGASFYFIFLENSLNRTENLRDELAGNLWAIHGGGFYYVEKYKIAPKELPKKLHWFKYEAYFTWLSGFFLLNIVYYMNAKAYMVDPSVRDISAGTAILIGIGSLVSGWVIYDLLCKSPLVHKKKAFAITGFLIVVAYSYFLSQFLSGRAAFMHVGALLGTIMAGNVFFVIIPSQKELVAAAKEGRPLNPELGKMAGLRSLHNNYITLPVIFVMISNHFPSTFGHPYNWAVLAGLTLASVAVRHYINLHEKGITANWMLPFATIAIISLVIVTAPTNKNSKNTAPVSFAEVQPIFQRRCVQCHSSKPTDDEQTVAPNGVMFETAEQIQKMTDKILLRAVNTHSMPQGNKTKMTDEERELIGRWIAQGAVVRK
jgi:uncharacterized membrane protein